MDIDPNRLEGTAAAARELVAHHGFPTRIDVTTDRRQALEHADFVIVTFQVGGLAGFQLDVEIPRRYGIDQTVGDTLGPGGVFRFLRSAPVYRDIAADMAELCPDALLINYANPMAMSCWYLDRLGVRTVGLCHSVQGTSRMLARQLGIPYDEVDYLAAGINHQAWFLRFRYNGEDLYPRLHEVMSRHLGKTNDSNHLATDLGAHSDAERGDTDYEGGQERVRAEIMASFGYFHTESSHHASEYLPYFRKSPEAISDYLPIRWDYYRLCASHDEEVHTGHLLGTLKERLAPSVEYGARIINATVTGEPAVVYGNVANRGLIANLPEGCCVEVPCLVDLNGVQPTAIGQLPPQCAALNQSNVNVQGLAVAAAGTGALDHVYHAVMVDPLTSAILPLPAIRAMVDELLEAESDWIAPLFQSNSLVSAQR